MDAVAIALNRFGLGARPGDDLAPDPRAWLVSQLVEFEPRPAALAGLPDRYEVGRDLAEFAAEARREAAAGQSADMAGAEMADAGGAAGGPAQSARAFLRRGIRDRYMEMNAARLEAALTTSAPFVERLVHFWANHFAVSADKVPITGMAGLLEFEAVRPNLLGRFGDLLLAVERHPAMLLYLDQAQSVGPNSQVGRATGRRGRQRGLNENLAREILELHTLGVDGGYSQADVTEFARALTGWTVGGLAAGPARRLLGDTARPGEFAFLDTVHEPGERTIFGRRYAAGGEAQARTVLADLAVHPATARHLATKLARHFAGDDPPQAMVARLERAWLDSGGDLPTVYRAIVASPEAWTEQPVKFKTPWEWVVSALRAVSAERLPPSVAAATLGELGQPTWRPGSPAGWDDIAASWAGSDALVRRAEVAERLAGRLATVAPVGDPAFAAVRGGWAEEAAAGARLDGFFALHPALAETAKLYTAGEALFVHAVASPYRERSHFDGQNVLESGGNAAYRLKDGWMNRLLGLLPPAESSALALSATVPVALRGVHEVSSYAPSRLPAATDDLLMRVGMMYEADEQLHAMWQSAMQTRAAAGDLAGETGRNGAAMGALAARLLSGEEGARVAMIETGGWDTHANQRPRLTAQLRGLDGLLAALKSGLGAEWDRTLVVVATEFGRTARPNGTGGTDHGTASAAMLLGGAVAGGKVVADWPGLAERALHEGRDLKPTTDLDALIAGALAQHYALDPRRTMQVLFPDSRGTALQTALVGA